MAFTTPCSHQSLSRRIKLLNSKPHRQGNEQAPRHAHSNNPVAFQHGKEAIRARTGSARAETLTGTRSRTTHSTIPAGKARPQAGSRVANKHAGITKLDRRNNRRRVTSRPMNTKRPRRGLCPHRGLRSAAAAYSPSWCASTIGDDGLNFSVRNG